MIIKYYFKTYREMLRKKGSKQRKHSTKSEVSAWPYFK